MSSQLSVIFKPTSRCNLRCHYCYAARERESFDGIMSLDEAKKAFDWISLYCQKLGVRDVTVIWHGGEPLLMGKDFIEECVDYYTSNLKKDAINVRNQIQTNLTLATDDFIPLLKKSFGSRIGFSLDYNSEYRVFPDGRCANNAIIERAKALKKGGLNLGAITMMTSNNIGKMGELYSFFKDLSIPFRLNRMFPTTFEETSELSNSVTAEEYANAVCELFDIWLNDPNPAFVETVHGAVLAYITDVCKLCSINGRCSDSFLCIAPNGVLLPCGRFDSDSYSIGNIYNDTPEQVLRKKSEIAKQSNNNTLRERCYTCQWKRLCIAGCLHSRLLGWFNDECTTNKIIWGHLKKRLTPLGITRGIISNINTNDATKIMSLFLKSYETTSLGMNPALFRGSVNEKGNLST